MPMQMAYWMRIAVGVVLGLVGLFALWPTVGIAWLTATVAVLLALIGFLGSYFVVSADRPEEGYEQVLFDKPNTIVSAILLVVFAGAGVGSGFLGADAAPPGPPDFVHALRADYQRTADAWGEDATKEDTLASLAALREESDRIAIELGALPEDERSHLEAANDALAFAIDALKACAEQEQRSCLDARINAADAEAALQRYAAIGAPE